MVFTILIGSVAGTYGQATQSLSLEQRVAALEAENARLRTLVLSLLDKVRVIESQPSSDGSVSKAAGEVGAEGFLGRWKKTKGDYYFNGKLDEITIAKEGDNLFVSIHGPSDVKGKFLAKRENGNLVISIQFVGVTYVTWIEKGKRLNLLGDEFERIGGPTTRSVSSSRP
jgi:hypothetical protein